MGVFKQPENSIVSTNMFDNYEQKLVRMKCLGLAEHFAIGKDKVYYRNYWGVLDGFIVKFMKCTMDEAIKFRANVLRLQLFETRQKEWHIAPESLVDDSEESEVEFVNKLLQLLFNVYCDPPEHNDYGPMFSFKLHNHKKCSICKFLWKGEITA